MPQYKVVARAPSLAFFKKDACFIARDFPTPLGPVTLLLSTRRTHVTGFPRPLARGLYAIIEGSASSLDEALSEFVSAAQSIVPLVSLVVNGPTEDLVPELGFDVSPDLAERDFFQHFVLEERLLPYRRRPVSIPFLREVASTLARHPENGRIHRAMAHYHRALQEWQPGCEIPAAHHLWMAAECLTPVVLRAEMARAQLTRDQLVEAWSVSPRDLDAEVRRRLIFRKDDTCYRAAKNASDGLEHGYENLRDIHRQARQHRVPLANHVRRAVIEALGIEGDMARHLFDPPFDVPGHLGFSKYLRGKLIGSGTELSATDQDFPIVTWKSELKPADDTDGEEIPVRITETITPRLGAGIAFRPESIEVWGSQ